MVSSMRTLTVDLGDRAYPIFIGPDLIAEQALYRHIPWPSGDDRQQ